MRRLFKRAAPVPAADMSALGASALALPMPASLPVPAGCIGVAFDKGGRTRRAGAGQRLSLLEHESALCFHPGPYVFDLLPFAAAPELGLRLAFAIDAPDPRVTQQRFDLYLASEATAGVSLTEIGAAMQAALQRELAQGNLELPPCTSLDEWDAFRAGLNKLLYTRFGLSVDDCVPIDLADSVDYAATLLARAQPEAAAAEPAKAPCAAFNAVLVDAQAMRRLFLELPGVTSALRVAALPPGQQHFRQHQYLLQRLGQVLLSVATMPDLLLAAPGKALPTHLIEARGQHAAAAVVALDEAWALLARFAAAQQFDEAERIVANLEYHCGGRRVAIAGDEDA